MKNVYAEFERFLEAKAVSAAIKTKTARVTKISLAKAIKLTNAGFRVIITK